MAMSLEWYEMVGCCGRIKLKVLALVITYINMVVCIIYLVLALVLCILLTTADVAVKKMNNMTVDSAANLVLESAVHGVIGGGGGNTIEDDNDDIFEGIKLHGTFVKDMNNIANGITGGGGKGTGSIGWRILLTGQPVIARCRSGGICKIKYTGSLRNRWEMGTVGIKSLLTFKLTIGNVKKLGFLIKHMILVATVWSVLLAVHLLFIVVLVTGLTQEYQILVKVYCFFGVVLLSLLIVMFFSHAAICSVIPVYYLLHICLYLYSLLVIIAYLAEQHANYGEEFYY